MRTKYIMPVIATCDNVIQTALDFNQCLPSHVEGFYRRVRILQKYAQKSRRDPKVLRRAGCHKK